jgi:hypothetical protein
MSSPPPAATGVNEEGVWLDHTLYADTESDDSDDSTSFYRDLDRHPKLVTLNLYDLHVAKPVNNVLGAINGISQAFSGTQAPSFDPQSPQLGAFHAGIECFHLEWSYGYIEAGAPGVHFGLPGQSHLGTLKQKIVLGYTEKSATEFMQIIEEYYFSELWRGDRYHLLSHNCCHFSAELALQLGVADQVPEWVNYLANLSLRLSPDMSPTGESDNNRRKMTKNGLLSGELNEHGPVLVIQNSINER